MEARPSGRVTLVRFVQSENAELPMEVRPSGRVTLVRFVQSENTKSSIEVTPSGMAIFPVQDSGSAL